jgi:DNA-3-methyladenine glycosylase
LVIDRRQRLPRSFYERESVGVAKSLLGAVLVSKCGDGITAGRIVEVEAYGDAMDLASHAARLKRGIESMSGPAGIAYVYRSYGIHAMFNIVAKEAGDMGAVLVRALEPLVGVELMRTRRGVSDDRRLTSGPGNVCQALAITLADQGTDLVESNRIWLVDGTPPERIAAGNRIGITKSTDLPWRFFDPDSPYLSAHRRGKILGNG